MFIVPSLLGCALFIMPVYYDGNLTILLYVLLKHVDKLIGSVLPLACVILSFISTVGGLIAKAFQPKFIKENFILKSSFDVPTGWIIVRTLGAIFSFMIYKRIGPEWLISNTTGGLVLNNLAPTCATIFFVSGFLLPLLLEYGLMDFFGTLCSEFFRKLFCLPGCSAVGCITSWFGAASTTVLLTDMQYQSGYYTARESSVVMTCFSTSSIAFALIVITQLDMEYLFFPFYLSTCIAGIVCALIIPRIPPLSRGKDEYFNGVNNNLQEETGEGCTRLQRAYNMALKKASEGYSFKQLLKAGARSSAVTMIGIVPAMIGIGTTALIISEYTTFFQWAGVPFIPLLKLMNVPEAASIASTLVGGFADNYIPAVLGKNLVQGALGKLVVGITAFNGIIFMSGTGAAMLQSKTHFTLLKLFIIFIERTIISIIISSFLGRIILFIF